MTAIIVNFKQSTTELVNAAGKCMPGEEHTTKKIAFSLKQLGTARRKRRSRFDSERLKWAIAGAELVYTLRISEGGSEVTTASAKPQHNLTILDDIIQGPRC
jgi:hypothetical protein